MKINVIIFLSIFILSSCDNAESNPDCSLVLCQSNGKTIKIKYVNKTTNSPLFAQGTAYTPGDLNVTATNVNYEPTVKLDSNDPTILIITPVFGGEVMTLGSLPADKITMQTRSRGNECCAGSDIISLKINDETICAPCNDQDITIAVIKK